jgi:hypothetical protein
MSSSLEDGGKYIRQLNSRTSSVGVSRPHRYKKTSQNNSAIESFTSNSNGAINPSTTSSASSSKVPPIPAEYQNTNIKRVNKAENAVMKAVVKDVNNSVNKAVTTGKDATTVANIFLNSSDKNSYKNRNVSTANNVLGSVNAMGVLSTFQNNVANNSNVNFAKTELNIPVSKALPINQNAQYPVITPGTLNSPNSVLLGQAAQLPTVAAQNNIAQYAGQNVYIYDRNPVSGGNIYYEGDYTSNLSLNYFDAGNVTAKQCFEQAADSAGQNGYGYAYAAIDSNGHCYTGTSPSGNWQSSYSKDIVLCEVFPGVTIKNGMIFLGANGGLYDGAPDDNDATNSNLLNKNLNNDILLNVDPIYGAAINNVNASYGLSGGMGNKNNMVFNDSVVSGTSPSTTGQANATLGTIRTTISQQQTCPSWMYDWWEDYGYWALDWDYARNKFCQTEEIVNYSDIHNGGEGQDVTLTYNCGKKSLSLPAQTVYQGTEVSINCFEQMSKYGIFYLQIADNGVITITNSAGVGEDAIAWTFTPTSDKQNLLSQSLTLKNMNTVQLNAPRYDWVQQSGVTSSNANSSTTLFTYPNVGNGLTTFSPGEFLSSPNGICRLKLGYDNKLVIEYSLYNLALDSSNYAVGNIANAASGDESYALYFIDNIQANNIGSLSYVDMNNDVFSYNQPQSGFSLGESYIESKNYLPLASASSFNQNVTPDKCAIICSNDDNCGGYTSTSGNCSTFTPDSLYPANQRIYTEGSSTFIREKKVTQDMTDTSCSKKIANITSDVYNNFGSYITGAPMTTDKLCGMAVVLDGEIQNMNTANAAAIAKGKTIKNQMNDIYKKQNNAINDLQTNNMLANIFEDITQDVDDAIERKKENAITKVAAKDNTELLLVSDNYKYIIWGIITLLLSIGAIKALRIGSS